MNNKNTEAPIFLKAEEKKWFLLILLVSSVQFLINERLHTAFEWTTLQFMPIAVRLLDPSFLQYDFYTNAASQSIAYIFCSVVNLLTYLGLSWYQAFYVFKVFVVILMKPVLVLAMFRILDYWKENDRFSGLYDVFKWGIAVIIVFPWFLRKFFAAPAGWWPLHNNTFLAPMTLALLIGFVYLFLVFSTSNRAQWISFVALIACTFIHPTVSVGIFVVRLIFSFNKKEIYLHCLQAVFGIAGPVLILLFLMSGHGNGISVQELVDVYVYTRHPHHYLMSAVIKKRFFFLIIFYVAFVIWALLKKEKSLIILSLLCLLGFAGPVLVQYLAVEVHPVKSLILFGASRITGFGAMTLILEALIFATRLNVIKRLSTELQRTKYFRYYDTCWGHWKLSFRGMGLLLVLLLVAAMGYATYVHPLETENGNRFKSCVRWLETNTPQDAVIFTHYNVLPSYYVRMFANRAIWADMSYTHNESVALEFKRRYLIEKRFPQFTKEDILNLFNEGVTYVILGNDERVFFHEATPVFQDGNRYIYTAESLGL